MKAIGVLLSETREGFRLIVAWAAGFLSFGLFSGFLEKLILHFQPHLSDSAAQSEAGLILLFCLTGLGVVAIVMTLLFEGLEVRPK